MCDVCLAGLLMVKRPAVISSYYWMFQFAVLYMKAVISWMMLCRWLQEAVRDNSVVTRLFIDANTEHVHRVFIRSLSYGIITLHSPSHTYKDTHWECNVRTRSEAHPCLSSVSQEILTLLLHHWRLHPLITISCISRWSQAGLTSLTRPLSLTVLIRMAQTLSVDVCVEVYGENYSCNCQGLHGVPLNVCVCVCGLVMIWHIGCAGPFNTQRSRCDTAWKDVLTETESLSVPCDETHFRKLETRAIIITQHHCPSLLQFVDPVW